jgi:hypothetical protein
MPFSFVCPYCETELEVPDGAGILTFKCPKCSKGLTAVAQECLLAISAYEKAQSEKKGRRFRATRTRPMLNRRGVIGAIEQSVAGKEDDPSGYRVLAEMKMEDMTFEALVLRHPELFSLKARQRASKRLKECQGEAAAPLEIEPC